MKRKVQRQEPIRCACEGGGNRAKEHAKPGSKAAHHGNPFNHSPGCIHSELQHTTRPTEKKRTVNRLRLQ